MVLPHVKLIFLLLLLLLIFYFLNFFLNFCLNFTIMIAWSHVAHTCNHTHTYKHERVHPDTLVTPSLVLSSRRCLGGKKFPFFPLFPLILLLFLLLVSPLRQGLLPLSLSLSSSGWWQRTRLSTLERSTWEWASKSKLAKSQIRKLKCFWKTKIVANSRFCCRPNITKSPKLNPSLFFPFS